MAVLFGKHIGPRCFQLAVMLLMIDDGIDVWSMWLLPYQRDEFNEMPSKTCITLEVNHGYGKMDVQNYQKSRAVMGSGPSLQVLK